MITVLVIPADSTRLTRQHRLDPTDIPAMEKLVGGLLHPVSLTDPESSLYLPAADARFPGPCNMRATALAAFHTRPSRLPRTILRGDALLTGPTTTEGRDTDVPNELVSLLRNRMFRVQTKQPDAQKWTRGRRYDGFEHAYAHTCNAVRGIPDDAMPLIRILGASPATSDRKGNRS
ncbi:hypothetical protein [Parafrankia sp. BMG5.11]|uniref:hypothetical protein n=1 Tax=Parafrankia sp. BMG5.11 TaxID=222540 RepID=UPI00103E679F|nr:hypothetical protein [Parafrankia sp. BMG5.11]TCJ36552.1 hypothetical protein E0504_22695 [Parafrankia sp. BMG5.11]